MEGAGSERLISIVVPANAGTHNHRCAWQTKDDDPKSLKQHPTRRRDERNCAHAGGPCFRRDDSVCCGCDLRMTAPLRAGVLAAIVTLIVDQAAHLWLLFLFYLSHLAAVHVP